MGDGLLELRHQFETLAEALGLPAAQWRLIEHAYRRGAADAQREQTKRAGLGKE